MSTFAGFTYRTAKEAVRRYFEPLMWIGRLFRDHVNRLRILILPTLFLATAAGAYWAVTVLGEPAAPAQEEGYFLWPVLIIGLVAFVSTSLLVPIVRHAALRRGWVDKPDGKRKLHIRPTPNIGGIAMAAGFGLGLVGLLGLQMFFSFDVAIPGIAVLLGGLVVVCTGLYDDIRGLSFKWKFVIQVNVAYLLIISGYRFDFASLPFVGEDPVNQALYAAPLTMLWIVGVINAVNLLDGLEGLATGVSIIAFATLAALFGIQGDAGNTVMAVLMVGVLAGFLLYNFNPASIFMGDSGSLFIGYMLAVYTLEGKAHINPWLAIFIPIVVLGLPVLDTLLSIVRRFVAGRSPFAPDSDHIHHRLARLWSTRQAVFVLYGVAVWFGAAALLMQALGPPYAFVVFGVTLLAAFIGLRLLGYLDGSRQEAGKAFEFYSEALGRATGEKPSQLPGEHVESNMPETRKQTTGTERLINE